MKKNYIKPYVKVKTVLIQLLNTSKSVSSGIVPNTISGEEDIDNFNEPLINYK